MLGLNSKKRFSTFIFYIHLIFQLFSSLAPFLLSWPIILLMILVMQIQFYWLGGCILNRWQFPEIKEDIIFTQVYLNKMGLHINPDKMRIIMRYIIPLAIFVGAFVWQQIYNHPPLLF